MHIVQVGFGYDDDLPDADTLLGRYATLTGWAEALASGGVRSSVVQRFHRTDRIERGGVTYCFCATGLHRTLRELQPDIVHVNGLNFPMETWRCRRALAPASALVVQDHASGDPQRGVLPTRLLRDAIRRRALQSIDAFFFTAAEQAQPWRDAGFITAEQPVFQVMEASTGLHPIDRHEAREMSGVRGDPAVLWVGRLNANKDPLTVLDGFEQVLTEFPAAALTMVYGERDLEHEIRARIAASPALTAHVTLAGRIPHTRLAAYYSAADLFVLGSHHEGSGYALLEACASGVIPIVTDIATFRVITADGSIGAMWPLGDARAFAGAFRKMAGVDRATLRDRVRRHFDAALSWPSVARQAIAAYDDVLQRRRRA